MLRKTINVIILSDLIISYYNYSYIMYKATYNRFNWFFTEVCLNSKKSIQDVGAILDGPLD